MEYQSLKFLHELISHDLSVLECSNLNQASPEKYQEFKRAYYDLQRKVVLYQNSSDASSITINSNTILSLKWDFANLSSKFDFYMGFLGGAKEILNYQIEKIKENIESIIQGLNKDNYKEVKRKMEDALLLYQNILDRAVSTKEIQDLVAKVHYQIYKYQVEDFLVPNYDITSFIPFVYEDMQEILDSDAVSFLIKEEINKYFLDASLVKKYFNRIVMLINMASNPHVSRKELEEKLDTKLYQEDDIKPEYEEVAKDILTEVRERYIDNMEWFYDSIYLYCDFHNIDKKHVAPLFFASVKTLQLDYDSLVRILNKYGYTNIKFLGEAIISFFVFLSISVLMDLKDAFARIGQNYDYEIECAIIAQKERIKADELVQYVLKNHSSYLINYILTSENLKLLVQFYLETKSQEAKEKIEYLLRHGKITSEVFNELPIEDFKNAIIDAFKDRSNDEIEEFLLSFSVEKLNWLVEELLKSNYFDDFFQSIYQKVDDGSIKATFLKMGYGSYLSYKPYSFYYNQSQINLMNPIGAYYVSKNVSSLDDCGYFEFLYFLEKFYFYKLDWQNLIKACKLREFDTRGVYKYFCLGNKEEFIQYYKEHDINLDSHFFLEVIKSDENAISDWLEFLSVDDILALNESTLNIFVKYYKEKLESEHLILNDKINQVFCKKGYAFDEYIEFISLLVYIMHTGLFDEDILLYIDNFISIPDFQKLLYKAIENSRESYLKVHYVLKIGEKYISIFAHCKEFIFMDEKSILELKNNDDEFSYLKLRKYFGDLLRLLDKVDEELRIQIIKEIVKSGIHEYIFYLKEHYPKYWDFILNNIDDACLYQSFIDYNGSMSIDDALKVEMLKRKL